MSAIGPEVVFELKQRLDAVIRLCRLRKPLALIADVASGDIPWRDAAGDPDDPDCSPPRSVSLRDVKDECIADALDRCNGSITRASRLLGINRTTLYYWLRRRKETPA